MHHLVAVAAVAGGGEGLGMAGGAREAARRGAGPVRHEHHFQHLNNHQHHHQHHHPRTSTSILGQHHICPIDDNIFEHAAAHNNCQLQAGGGEERPSEEAQQAEEAPPAAHGAGEDGGEEAAAGAKLVADQLSGPS